LLYSFTHSKGQTPALKFDIQFQGNSLELDKEYSLNGNPIKITKCKFYLSKIHLSYNHPKDSNDTLIIDHILSNVSRRGRCVSASATSTLQAK